VACDVACECRLGSNTCVTQHLSWPVPADPAADAAVTPGDRFARFAGVVQQWITITGKADYAMSRLRYACCSTRKLRSREFRHLYRLHRRRDRIGSCQGEQLVTSFFPLHPKTNGGLSAP